MDRIRTALEQLDQAIARLEGALEAREARFDDERDAHARMRAAAEAASLRLDGVLSHLHEILED